MLDIPSGGLSVTPSIRRNRSSLGSYKTDSLSLHVPMMSPAGPTYSARQPRRRNSLRASESSDQSSSRHSGYPNGISLASATANTANHARVLSFLAGFKDKIAGMEQPELIGEEVLRSSRKLESEGSSSTSSSDIFGDELVSYRRQASLAASANGVVMPLNPKDFTDLLDIEGQSPSSKRRSVDEATSHLNAREAQFKRYRERRAIQWANQELAEERAKVADPTQAQISNALREQRLRQSNVLERRRQEMEVKQLLQMPMLDRIALCLTRPQVQVPAPAGPSPRKKKEEWERDLEDEDGEEDGANYSRRGASRSPAKLLEITVEGGLTSTAPAPALGSEQQMNSRKLGKFILKDADELNQRYEAHMTSEDLRNQLTALGETDVVPSPLRFGTYHARNTNSTHTRLSPSRLHMSSMLSPDSSAPQSSSPTQRGVGGVGSLQAFLKGRRSDKDAQFSVMGSPLSDDRTGALVPSPDDKQAYYAGLGVDEHTYLRMSPFARKTIRNKGPALLRQRDERVALDERKAQLQLLQPLEGHHEWSPTVIPANERSFELLKQHVKATMGSVPDAEGANSLSTIGNPTPLSATNVASIHSLSPHAKVRSAYSNQHIILPPVGSPQAQVNRPSPSAAIQAFMLAPSSVSSPNSSVRRKVALDYDDAFGGTIAGGSGLPQINSLKNLLGVTPRQRSSVTTITPRSGYSAPSLISPTALPPVSSEAFLSDESDKAFLWNFEVQNIRQEAVDAVYATNFINPATAKGTGGGILSPGTSVSRSTTPRGGDNQPVNYTINLIGADATQISTLLTSSKEYMYGGDGMASSTALVNPLGLSAGESEVAHSANGSTTTPTAGSLQLGMAYNIPSCQVVLPTFNKKETLAQALRRRLNTLVQEQRAEDHRQAEMLRKEVDAASAAAASGRTKIERAFGSFLPGRVRGLTRTRKDLLGGSQMSMTMTTSNLSRSQLLASSQGPMRTASTLSEGSSNNGDRARHNDSKAELRHQNSTAGGTMYRRKLFGSGRFADYTETPFISAHATYADEQELAPTNEEETNIPAQDLHLYSLFCAYQKMTIIIRPVSQAATNIYAGTAMVSKALCAPDGNPVPRDDLDFDEIASFTNFECRVKGKSINVSLKSSPYPPIDGLIPVNPALGKAYLDAVKRAREIDDMILNNNGNVVPLALMRKREAQKAQAESATAAFVRDIITSLQDSNARCSDLLAKYHAEVITTTDKESISKQYIDVLNNAQFLGTKRSLWRGLEIYYNDLGIGGVERVTEEGPPCFYIKRDDKYYAYSTVASDINPHPVQQAIEKYLQPVEVVSHRQFFVSPITKRIEEDPDSFLIGPDFDGLAYARNVHYVKAAPHLGKRALYTSADHIKFAHERTTIQQEFGMGLVNAPDLNHIKEMRELTSWKQNHGYECNNTVKSQALTPGPYVLITPSNTRILHTFEEVIGYYRWAWLDGTPLLLSPNWRVALRNGLPCPLGEDVWSPVVDDCGSQQLEFELDTKREKGLLPSTLTLKSLSSGYVSMPDRIAKLKAQSTVHKTVKAVAHSEVAHIHDEYSAMRDKKEVAQSFYALRRWQLLPPLFAFDEEAAAAAAGTSSATEPIKSFTFSAKQTKNSKKRRSVEETLSRAMSLNLGSDLKQVKSIVPGEDGEDEEGGEEEEDGAGAEGADEVAEDVTDGSAGLKLKLRSSAEARDDYTHDPVFEAYRLTQIDRLAKEFLEMADQFDSLHPPAHTKFGFILHLKSYLWPDYEDLPNLTTATFTSHADLL